MFVLIDLCWVNIDVNNASTSSKFFQLSSHTIIKTHTDRQEQIRLMNSIVCSHSTVHSQHLQCHWILFWEGSKSHQRLGHWNPSLLDKLCQLGVCIHTPSSNVQHWSLRFLNSLDDSLQLIFLCRHWKARNVSPQIHRVIPIWQAQRLLYILWDINKHRPRATGTSQIKRFLHDAWDILHIHHQIVVLGDLPGNLHNRRLLEPISTNQFTWHLTSNRHKRHRI
mmetsp:Transcript_9263/g.18396  ORF Transcript_9263/g.18396 Transcript_9263/m.18396 type:complete len:223 (-) Transcript_9263:621-1289(-)